MRYKLDLLTGGNLKSGYPSPISRRGYRGPGAPRGVRRRSGCQWQSRTLGTAKLRIKSEKADALAIESKPLAKASAFSDFILSFANLVDLAFNYL